MLRLEVGLLAALQGLPDQCFDRRQQLHFVGADQRHRLAGGTGTAGTADAMHVVLGDDRQVEVDHQRHFLDIQATRGHVGGYQQVYLAGLKPLQGAQPRRLRLVAMDRVGGDTLPLQQSDQFLDALAGLGEDQRLAPAIGLQQVAEQLGLALLVHRHQPLPDALRRGIARTDLDGQRVAQQFTGQRADGVGEGRGKQQGLALARQRGEQFVQLAGETEVEHAIGFVQHQRLELGELHRVLPIQVEQPPGSGDEDIHSLAQLHHLRVDADPTVGHRGTQRQVLAVVADAGVDLLGQFAGRNQDQCTHRVRSDLRPLQGQPLQQRQGETGGLAGAGLCCGEQVAALERRGYGLGLDRRRRAVAEPFEGLEQGVEQTEGSERHERLGKKETDGILADSPSPIVLWSAAGQPLSSNPPSIGT